MYVHVPSGTKCLNPESILEYLSYWLFRVITTRLDASGKEMPLYHKYDQTTCHFTSELLTVIVYYQCSHAYRYFFLKERYLLYIYSNSTGTRYVYAQVHILSQRNTESSLPVDLGGAVWYLFNVDISHVSKNVCTPSMYATGRFKPIEYVQ